MRYLSLFSGIEAASVAWEPLGWEPMAFSEIEQFPCAVLRERFPDVPNLGDVTKIDWGDFLAKHGRPDLVVGGSPCQSFSVAGKREGLSGESGLMYEYIRAVQELRPRWLLWENVPGALSVEHGAAFGQLLSSLDDCGYGLAWRVLDAQFCRVAVWDDSGELVGFFGPVAQRRRRVFLVGCLADGCAAEVLLEPEGMSGDYQSSREKRQELAEATKRGAARNGDLLTPIAFKHFQGAKAGTMPVYEDGSVPTIVGADGHEPAIAINHNQDPTTDVEHMHALDHNGAAVSYALRMRSGKEGGGKGPLVQDDVSGTIATGNDQTLFVMASGQSHSEIGRGGVMSDADRTCLQGGPNPVRGRRVMTSNNDDVFPSLCATDGDKQFIDNQSIDGGRLVLESVMTSNGEDVVGALCARDYKGIGSQYVNEGKVVAQEQDDVPYAATLSDGTRWIVRRLTPIECERLMGFPDGWTDIGDWVDAKGKRHKPADGPRYKALGNSFAVPVIRWIGERIDEADIWAQVTLSSDSRKENQI